MDYGTNTTGFVRPSFGVVLIAGRVMMAEAEEAIQAAGGRIVSRIDWDDAPSAIGREGDAAIMLVEARGVAPERLETLLPRIDAVATALDRRIVVTLGEAEIDLVAAMLLGPRVEMLCDPSAAERIAALTIAAGLAGEPMLHDRVREGEGDRLRRLNEEVARIAEVLFRLTARDGTVANDRAVADRRGSYGAPVTSDDVPVDPERIRDMIRARRLRETFFAPGLFEDPAWDMMLDLYAAELEGGRVSVSSLCIASAVASTTALRWIAKLTDLGWFVRHPDPYDRRRAYMALSERASAAMLGYARATIRQAAPIA